MNSKVVQFQSLFLEPTRNGLTRPRSTRGTGIFMVNMGELFAHGRLSNVEMDRVQVTAVEASKFQLEPGDLLFARQSLVLEGAGKCSVFLESREPVTFESHIIRARLDRKRVDPLFYYYFFQSSQGRGLVQSIVEQGAGASGIRGSDLAHLQVPFPELQQQRAIAHILGTLDDKIELNRQMNQTLEQIAAALFRSWFIDFDPVRAKMAGREPEGMDAATAALFPERLVASELGEIPEGWEVGPILNLARLLSGGTPKTSRAEYWGGNVLWASAKDVSQCNDLFLIATERTITELGVQESSTRLIPPFCTVVVARGATTGRMVLFGREMAMNQTCYALETRTQTPFALCCLLRRQMGNLVHTAHGSVFDTITTSTFSSSRIVLPPARLLKQFEDLVAPQFRRILSATEESATLARLRGALLPRLLSGELRVPDIDSGKEAI